MSSERNAVMYSALTEQIPKIATVVQVGMKSGDERLIVESLKGLRIFVKMSDVSRLGIPTLEFMCQFLLPQAKYTVYCLAVLGEIASTIGDIEARNPLVSVFG